MTINETILKNQCSNCGSSDLIEDKEQGEIICQHCGLVVKENAINEGPEWRTFSEEGQDRSRVGMPFTLSIHDKGLFTTIDKANKDAFGREIPTSIKQEMYRLRKWQTRASLHSSADQNLVKAMSELNMFTDKLLIQPSTKEQAAQIYRKSLEKGLVRGRSITAIMAASLYAACRFTTAPKTLKQISKITQIKRKELSRCYRLLLRELDIKMPIVDPTSCVPKIASKINIEEKTQQIAINLIRDAEKKKAVTGKDPMGIAAAALYIACILNYDAKKRTQKEIANAAEVTEVTVRNRHKGLKKLLKLDI